MTVYGIGSFPICFFRLVSFLPLFVGAVQRWITVDLKTIGITGEQNTAVGAAIHWSLAAQPGINRVRVGIKRCREPGKIDQGLSVNSGHGVTIVAGSMAASGIRVWVGACFSQNWFWR